MGEGDVDADPGGLPDDAGADLEQLLADGGQAAPRHDGFKAHHTVGLRVSTHSQGHDV